jgi:hypothetical protein
MAQLDIPNEYDLQAQEFERRRKFAEALQQQAQSPLQGGMVGNTFVSPSWTQGLAKVLQAYMGDKQLQDVTDEQKSAATARKNAFTDTLQGFNTALQGKPELQTSANDFDESGAAIPQRTVPAVPGDRNAAMAMLLKNPDTAGVGMQLAMQGMTPSKFGNTPHYDQAGRAFVLDEQGNTKYLGDIKARDKAELSPSGVAYNPYNLQPGTVMPDPNKPFAVGQNGAAVPNIPYQQYEIGKAHAGASNVNVKTDVKTGESLAGQIGPMMAASKGSAQGAVQQMDVANRIDSAINGGKLYTGPGAKLRMGLAQVGETLGVSGKDTREKLQNTRTAIQSLAQFSLTGRSALKGQGQISDFEGKLLERAVSGNIDDLTIPEIKVLSGVAKRVANAQYSEHQQNLKTMRGKPGLGDVADFYAVPEMPGTGQTTPTPSGSPGKIIRFDAQGNQL